MPGQFDFDEKKTAQQNIEDFLAQVESNNGTLGQLLRKHLKNMIPLPEEPNKRSAARAAFNGEIKRLLDAALAAQKPKHG